jgi:hypothetical protein
MQARSESEPFDNRTYSIFFILMMSAISLFGIGLPATIIDSLGVELLPALVMTASGALLLGLLLLIRNDVATFTFMMGLSVMSVVITVASVVDLLCPVERVRVVREEFGSYVMTVTTAYHHPTPLIGTLFLFLVAGSMLVTGLRYFKKITRRE